MQPTKTARRSSKDVLSHIDLLPVYGSLPVVTARFWLLM
jgi:hypothetical protein